MMERLGLFRSEEYDPAKHGEFEDVDEGDTILLLADDVKALILGG